MGRIHPPYPPARNYAPLPVDGRHYAERTATEPASVENGRWKSRSPVLFNLSLSRIPL